MDTITERIAASPKPGRQDQAVLPERESKCPWPASNKHWGQNTGFRVRRARRALSPTLMRGDRVATPGTQTVNRH
jgi:hypothetical protein